MTGPLRVGRNTSGDADYPHRLFLDGNPLGFVMLTDAEADAIEAQLAGPDLTDLRRHVTRFRKASTRADVAVAEHDVINEALRLVDGTDGAAPEPDKTCVRCKGRGVELTGAIGAPSCMLCWGSGKMPATDGAA